MTKQKAAKINEKEKWEEESFIPLEQKQEQFVIDMHYNYTSGLKAFNEGKYSEAAIFFSSAVKPVLSKTKMLKIRIINANQIHEQLKSDNDNDYQSKQTIYDQVLNAMYHLGKCYLEGVNELTEFQGSLITGHYAKAAGIFQYCATFGNKTYGVQGSDEQKHYQEHITDWKDKRAKFINAAMQVESEFLSSLDLDSKKKYDISEIDIEETKKQIKYYKNKLKEIREIVKSELDSIKNLETTHLEARKPLELQLEELNTSSQEQDVESEIKELEDTIEAMNLQHIAIRTAKVQEIYAKSNEFFVNHDCKKKQGFLQQIIADCESQLPIPKPKEIEYSIIGLGSIALGTMTPWSDIEFAILINDSGDERIQEEYKEYCRNLTKLLRIKLVNLGETPLRAMGIEHLNNRKVINESHDWFWDDVTEMGLRFDSVHPDGCKTPFGRINYEKRPDFELIGTTTELAEFQREETTENQEKNWFATDKHLVHSLRSICLISGNKEIVTKYKQAINNAELISNKIIQERALQILQEDIARFELKLGPKEEGKLIDVKRDMYRLADRIIDGLGNYYNIRQQSNDTDNKESTDNRNDSNIDIKISNIWKMIDIMQTKDLLSQKGAQHLKEAVSIAAELRMSTYANNIGQHETMSTYIPATDHLSDEEAQKLIHKTFHVQDTSILHHFYYVMLPLQEIIKSKILNHNLENLDAEKNNLFDNNNYNKGMVHARFLEYKKAINYLKKFKENNTNNEDVLRDLWLLYKNISDIENIITIGVELFEIIQQKYMSSPNHPYIAYSHSILGINYALKRKYDEFFEYFYKALQIIKVAYASNPNHPDIATSYNNLGVVYKLKIEYDKAIEYGDKALKITKVAYASNLDHPDIARSYNNLSNSYELKGDYNKAIEYGDKALKIIKVAYASNPNHPDIADSYNNLGNSYVLKGDYDKALEYYDKALQIRKVAYASNPDHPYIATSYNNLGVVYKSKGDYDKALEYYDKVLQIRKVAYASNPNHPDIADSYNNLGIVYNSKGEYDKAIEYHDKVLQIIKVAYASNPNHPDIAASYNNLGGIYESKRDYDKAIEYYDKALQIIKVAYASNPNHSDIAVSYNNLGAIYEYKGDYNKAIEYGDKALQIRKVAYASNPDHPDIADSYNNLGVVYKSKGDYDKALEYFDKALQIRKVAYASNPNHPYIAMSYNNLGGIYEYKGDYDKALEYYDKALQIRKVAYASNPDHPDIATSYNNLGNSDVLKGDYNKAIEYYDKALQIRNVAYASNPDHPDIAVSYNNLGTAYNAKSEYDEALTYAKKAVAIFSLYSNKQFFTIATNVLHTILVQLCNKALLEDRLQDAKNYLLEINEKYNNIDFTSIEFIKLQFNYVNKAYEENVLISAISCQLVLVKIDPELKYGNYYHNLACFYACDGKINEANTAFQKALMHNENNNIFGSGLCVEYAQFLIFNKEKLEHNFENEWNIIVSNYLYKALGTDNSGLQYGQMEKNTIIPILKILIEENNGTISIAPQTLAYYFLITHPEYLREGDTQEEILNKLASQYDSSDNDQITFKILIDACKVVGNNELLQKYIRLLETEEGSENSDGDYINSSIADGTEVGIEPESTSTVGDTSNSSDSDNA